MNTPGTVADFEPGQILRALEAHHVRYVVIGAIAAIAAGAPILTTDLDVTPSRSRENLERLALALRDLDARLRSASAPDGVPFPIEAEMLATADSWTLTTRAGDVDLMFLPAGTQGYDDLRSGARRERIAGVIVSVAALADVIRSKEAANREKDNMQLPILRRTLEQTRERGRGSPGATCSATRRSPANANRPRARPAYRRRSSGRLMFPFSRVPGLVTPFKGWCGAGFDRSLD